MIQNTKELYEKMLATPNLCGKFELVGETIFWSLFEGIDIEISAEPAESFLNIEKKGFAGASEQLLHCHPDRKTVFEKVCDMGLKGNVLVIRRNLLFSAVIYCGKEESCPYSPNVKWSWGKIYYLKAK